MRSELIKVGFCVSPNNIHALPGCLVYASGPGVWTVPNFQEIQVLEDRIRVFRPSFFGDQYSKRSYWDTVTVAVFDNVPDFMAWCQEHGKVSEPGCSFDQGMD